MQRVSRKAHDPVQANHERAPEAVVLARSRSPRLTIVEDARLAEPDQPDEPPQKPVTLLQRDHVVDHPTAHQAKVAGVRGDLDVRYPSDHPVAEGRDDALRDRLAGTGAPLCVDDVVALAPAHEQLGD